MQIEKRNEEERLRLLISAVTDYAIYMLDPNGIVATWNPGAERFKGYSAEEIIGQHFSRFYTEEDRADDLPARALRIAAREGRFEAEGWRLRKDGARFWAHVVIDPIRDDDGQLIGFAKITRDITQKKAKEKELYESEQRFRMLVQGVKDAAIYMLDQNGYITNWNAGAQAIKGYAAEEVVGEHFSRFYTEEDRAAGEPEKALETALREGKYELEAWRVRKNGTLFWAQVLLDPITDERGEHVGFAKITRDATERKRAQQELEETRAALAQSQKLQALGELAGGIAHDFNNVMTVIMGAADFIRRRPDLDPEKRRQYIDAICEAGSNATRLTEQLLTFGRRRPLRNEVIDVNAALDSFGEILSHTLGSRIQIALNLGGDAGRINVDPAQLEMAVLNAVMNARDAMPDGGRLTISSMREQEDDRDEVRISIKDSGLGMPKRVLERAFDPFFTTKSVGKGTGLGLSQIHGFAAQSKGRAELESDEGAGTLVSIILPRTRKAMARPQEESGELDIPEGIRVLLVEDNEQVRSYVKDLVQDLGCEAVSAASGKEALALLKESSFDLVLSDIVMPEMSGLELAAEIRQTHGDIPIILATGYSEEAARADQGLPIVLKPYSYADIKKAFAQALNPNAPPQTAEQC